MKADLRTLIVALYALQAVAITAWWLMLMTVPESMQWFKPERFDRGFFFAFLPPDTVIVFASILTAVAVARRSQVTWSLGLGTACLAVYPTFYCVALSHHTGEAWISSGLMATMLCANCIALSILGTCDSSSGGSGEYRIYEAKELPQLKAICQTLLQTFVFWSFFLYILPNTIREIETFVGIPRIEMRHLWPWWLFGAASLLGLWSGFTMAAVGRGTPLPTNTAPRLVVAGPYRWVRNPMALAGLAQGLAVGALIGSPAVVVLSVVSCVVWHVAIRPSEEVDLAERFGDAYLEYRASVWLWLPIRIRS
jgi:protein-S-isoprenylcysteine O-methyltransferase Ste14